MEGGAKGGDGTSDRGVFVRNLAFDTTSSQLEETFESVGPIKSCFVVTDPGTSKSRGYGYDSSFMDIALSHCGTILQG